MSGVPGIELVDSPWRQSKDLIGAICQPLVVEFIPGIFSLFSQQIFNGPAFLYLS